MRIQETTSSVPKSSGAPEGFDTFSVPAAVAGTGGGGGGFGGGGLGAGGGGGRGFRSVTLSAGMDGVYDTDAGNGPSPAHDDGTSAILNGSPGGPYSAYRPSAFDEPPSYRPRTSRANAARAKRSTRAAAAMARQARLAPQ